MMQLEIQKESGYWADVAWNAFVRPFKKANPIFFPGECMEDAVNNFYQNNQGGDIMHIYEQPPTKQ